MRHWIRTAPRHRALALLAVLATSGAAAAPTTVVELFTSQGCSSCPPADALLGRIAGEAGVIALSLHVDYWDRLGWTDPFGRAAHTERQERYAGTLEKTNDWTGPVYTPQAVVDGRYEVVGHAEASLRAAIATARRPDTAHPRFDEKGTFAVVVPAAAGTGDPPPAEVHLVAWDRRHVTAVRRGENDGRTLTNHYVVREMTTLGHWNGERRVFAVDAEAARARGRDGLAVLVQATPQGAILGAARYRLTAPAEDSD